MLRNIIHWFTSLFESSRQKGKNPPDQQKQAKPEHTNLNTPPSSVNPAPDKVDKKKFLQELKSTEPFEKQFEPIKEKFIEEIKKANPKQPPQ